MQVVGARLLGRAHVIAVIQDAQHQWLKPGVDIGEEKLPQGVGLLGRGLMNDGTNALLALVDDGLGVLLMLVALNHGQHRACELGTLTATAIASAAMPGRSLTDWLAVGSGFGYYSLSSILITQYRGPELGTIALLANIIREVITLLGAPLMVRYFGPLAPISSGGATTMDTTLPIITRTSGQDFVILSLFHGFLVDFSVPFLVSFFCSF